jgi:hypothetical protein
MYNVIRAAKTGPNRQARTCVFLADNYSENKNNHVLAFCSELVMHGCRLLVLPLPIFSYVYFRWYDDVTIVYGPVGHTHNGVDAYHRQHNQVLSALQFTSITQQLTPKGLGMMTVASFPDLANLLNQCWIARLVPDAAFQVILVYSLT